MDLSPYKQNDDFPEITIAILNYNGLKYLKQSVQNCLELSYPNYEILVVDNGSDDGSVDYLNGYHRRVRVVRLSENAGCSRGKNICVEHSSGRYVLLLDNDVLISDRFYLERILRYYNTLPDIAFLSLIMVDKGRKTTKYYGTYYSWYGLNIHKPFVELKNITRHRETIKVGSFNGGAVFFKKEIWEKLGGYDESQPIMLDDFDLGARAYARGYSNYLYKDKALIHLGKERDLDKEYFSWKYRYFFSGMATVLLKNHRPTNLIRIFPMFLLSSLFLYPYLALIKKNIYIIPALARSSVILFTNFNVIFKKRKLMQKERVNEKDVCLEIKPPQFW